MDGEKTEESKTPPKQSGLHTQYCVTTNQFHTVSFFDFISTKWVRIVSGRAVAYAPSIV